MINKNATYDLKQKNGKCSAVCVLQRGVDGMNRKSVHFSLNSIFFTNMWKSKLSDVLIILQYEVKLSLQFIKRLL